MPIMIRSRSLSTCLYLLETTLGTAASNFQLDSTTILQKNKPHNRTTRAVASYISPDVRGTGTMHMQGLGHGPQRDACQTCRHTRHAQLIQGLLSEKQSVRIDWY